MGTEPENRGADREKENEVRVSKCFFYHLGSEANAAGHSRAFQGHVGDGHARAFQGSSGWASSRDFPTKDPKSALEGRLSRASLLPRLDVIGISRESHKNPCMRTVRVGAALLSGVDSI